MKSVSRCFSLVLVLLSIAGGISLSRTACAQLPRPTYFSLENNNSHLCLSLPGAADQLYPGDGLQLTQMPCDGRQGEIWYQGAQTTNGGTGVASYTLASDYYCCSFLVAGVQAGVMQNGTPVITWSEDPTKYGVPGAVNNQGWGLVQWNLNYPAPQDPDDPPCYLLYNAGGIPVVNGQQGVFVMGVYGGSTSPGAPVVIWNWGNDPNYPYLANSDQYWCAITPGPPNPLT